MGVANAPIRFCLEELEKAQSFLTEALRQSLGALVACRRNRRNPVYHFSRPDGFFIL
jgi:hypothetical protein